MNLQRKLLETARRKTSVEQELMLERQRYLDVLVTRLDALRARGNATGSAESSMTHRSLPEAPNTAVSPSAATQGEKSTAEAAGSAATPLRSPPLQLSKSAVKDAAPGGTPHALTLTPSLRPSCAGTPRSGDLTPLSSHSSETHHAVVALERKLNQLLLEQAAAMQRTSATERQCAELGAKLRSVQEATFLDRARASKLKEELKEARKRLAEADGSSTANASVTAEASFDDATASVASTRSFDPSVSLTMSNVSLRERTRELLSSIPPHPMN